MNTQTLTVVFVSVLATCGQLCYSSQAPAFPETLPEGPLIIGYATACKPKIIEETRQGVNVLIWFATSLVQDPVSLKPRVVGGPNHTCVAETAKQLREEGLRAVHLISIGGWDAPHPNTSFTGAEWWEAWSEWNQRQVAVPELGFPGYAGIDWDLEGNDDVASPWNTFTVACLDLVGEMSQAAKQAGYIVSLVPPQSYFDVETSLFDRSLLNAYPQWHPEFAYRGHNAYALLVAKYGAVPVQDPPATGGTPRGAGRTAGGAGRTTRGAGHTTGGAGRTAGGAGHTAGFQTSAPGLPLPTNSVATFDFVDIQLYESWSRASEAVAGRGEDPAEYLRLLVQQLEAGWLVDFASDPAVLQPSTTVRLPPAQLVLGFSRGGPHSGGKSVFIHPRDIGRAWAALDASQRPRGFMFWNMMNDGGPAYYANGTMVSNVSFASSLNDFLHVRHAIEDTFDDSRIDSTTTSPISDILRRFWISK